MKPTFSTLWSRVSERGDFPTLQRNISNIVSAMHNEHASTAELVSVILSDFTLTQQVIRLANSAMYAAFGGKVTTVSRALTILGVDAVGHLALGLRLVDNFSGLADALGSANQELQQVLVASEFARKITLDKGPKEAEEAVVCTLLRNLARLMVVFYFPEEWARIQSLTQQQGVALSDACAQVLGVSLQELTDEVTRQWGLPSEIVESMQPRPLDMSTPLDTHSAWLSAVAGLSNTVAEQLLAQRSPDSIRDMLTQHAAWLGVQPNILAGLALDSANALFLSQEGERTEDRRLQVPSPGKPADSGARLQRSLEEISLVAPTLHLNELTPLALESWMQAFGFERCFSMFLNGSTKRYEAKLGFGLEGPAKLPRLSFEQGFVPDVFHIALTQRNAVFIADAERAEFSSRLPAWYAREFAGTRSFIILPLQLRNQGVGLFYGDWGSTACSALSPEELAATYKLGRLLTDSIERLIPTGPSPAYASTSARRILT